MAARRPEWRAGRPIAARGRARGGQSEAMAPGRPDLPGPEEEAEGGAAAIARGAYWEALARRSKGALPAFFLSRLAARLFAVAESSQGVLAARGLEGSPRLCRATRNISCPFGSLVFRQVLEVPTVLRKVMDKKRRKVAHKCRVFNRKGGARSDKTENMSVILASYKVAYTMAKNGKPFTDGPLIKELVLDIVEEINPEKLHVYKRVCLAPSTIERRIEDIGCNIVKQIADKARNFHQYSLALGESTEVCDTSQLLVFIRGVDEDFNVTQEFVSVRSMYDTVTGEDIFQELEKTLLEYKLEWSKLKCVTIDRGKNLSGVKKDLIEQITKAAEVGGFSKPMFLHCTIYQQELCGKYFDMSCVLKPVVSIVNYIRYNGLRHSHFREFLEETDSEFVIYESYTTGQLLSCEKVLSRFFELREVIKSFLEEENQPEPLLSNTDWLWKLALFADLAGHMNQLNLKFQDESNLVTDVFLYVGAFKAKLLLFERELQGQNLDHFPCTAKFREDSRAEFPASLAKGIIGDLQKQFHKQFSDLDGKKDEIEMFQNPFACDVYTLPAPYQLEIIDLQCSNRLKYMHREQNLVQFYRSLTPEQFPNLKQFARGYVSMFGTTQLCEQTLLNMKCIKAEDRDLSDANLKSMLMIGSSSFQPHFSEILQVKHQLHI
ncbi:general transcription factor II-I repeat domain-containing protein 2-like [Tiliqua scincoides]|uniref:general transcription factor II-I repeat domain-containing protein 2-like n=1 Tax=Tiliqua scincoides TaxID=71010 RepID=UPI0034618E1D